MKQEIREAAIKWWDENITSWGEWFELRKKYQGDKYEGSDGKILIYLKEQESKEVSNVSDVSDGENLRIQAIIWWHDLAFDEREKYYDGYKKWTPAKDHTQLTGREIQNIWAVAMNPPEPKEEPVSYLSDDKIWEAVAKLNEDMAKEKISLTKELIKELLEALYNSNTQMRYLNQKFKETGTTNAVISINESAITKAEQYLNK